MRRLCFSLRSVPSVRCNIIYDNAFYIYIETRHTIDVVVSVVGKLEKSGHKINSPGILMVEIYCSTGRSDDNGNKQDKVPTRSCFCGQISLYFRFTELNVLCLSMLSFRTVPYLGRIVGTVAMSYQFRSGVPIYRTPIRGTPDDGTRLARLAPALTISSSVETRHFTSLVMTSI